MFAIEAGGRWKQETTIVNGPNSKKFSRNYPRSDDGLCGQPSIATIMHTGLFSPATCWPRNSQPSAALPYKGSRLDLAPHLLAHCTLKPEHLREKKRWNPSIHYFDPTMFRLIASSEANSLCSLLARENDSFSPAACVQVWAKKKYQ